MLVEPTISASGSEGQSARRPFSLEATGLAEEYVTDLLLKHLLDAGSLSMDQVVSKTALLSAIVEPLVRFLRREALVEVRTSAGVNGPIRYGLTERGRAVARDAIHRDGYVGPAPVTLEDYRKVVTEQSASRFNVTAQAVESAFADAVMEPRLRDRLGPALHSGRAIFLYGPAGAGKTFVARRLVRALHDSVLIPHAVQVGGITVRVFDPQHHTVRWAGTASDAGARIFEGEDPRYRRCDRPLVVAGGELTLDVLDLQYDTASRQYLAPLQMKACNGVLLLDDLGRQRIPPEAILNRWIVPMEERRDYLHTKAGVHFSIPFDVVLVFATNLDPTDLADDAFLRRIGYKIPLQPMSAAEYERVWEQVCHAQGIAFEPELARFAMRKLHGDSRIPLLACYPRDLIGLAMDRVRYEGFGQLDQALLQWAWDNFVISAE